MLDFTTSSVGQLNDDHRRPFVPRIAGHRQADGLVARSRDGWRWHGQMWTTVEGLWTTLLACPIAGRQRRARIARYQGKTGRGSQSFGTVNPESRRRREGTAPPASRGMPRPADTQAVDNLWRAGVRPGQRADHVPR